MNYNKLIKELDRVNEGKSDLRAVNQLISRINKANVEDDDEGYEPEGCNYENIKEQRGKEFSIAKGNYMINSSGTWEFAGKYTVLLPHSLKGAVNCVKYAESKGKKIRPLGSRHSFSRVVQADDFYLDMCMTYAYSIEKHNETVHTLDQEPRKRIRDGVKRRYHFHALAGLKIAMINHILWPDKEGDKLLLKRKMRIFNMGGGDVQTFAGAFSTGTHGTGGVHSAYHDTIRSIELVAGGGRVYRIEPENGITDPARHKAWYDAHPKEVQVELIQDDDKFYSALINMGCFGIVYSVIMEITDATYLHEEIEYRKFGWTKALRTKLSSPVLPRKRSEELFYQIQINPYKIRDGRSNSVTIKTAKPTNDPASGKKMTHRKFWPTVFANSGLSAKVIRHISNIGRFPKKRLIETALKSQNDNTADGSMGYTDLPYKIWDAGSGKLKSFGTAIEFAFPTEKVPEIMKTFLPMMEQVGKMGRSYYLNVPVAFRFVRPSKSYLGPNHEYDKNGKKVKEWCYVEVLRVNGTNTTMDAKELEIYDHLQRFFTALGGRPHWGLNFNYPFSKQVLRELYPKFDLWLESYRFFNNTGVFSNKFTKEAGLDEGLPA